MPDPWEDWEDWEDPDPGENEGAGAGLGAVQLREEIATAMWEQYSAVLEA